MVKKTGDKMKNSKWIIILAIAIIGAVVYFVWNRQPKLDRTLEDNSQTTLKFPATDEMVAADSPLLTVPLHLKDTYSATPHTPTSVELAIDIREISPELRYTLLRAYEKTPEIVKNEAASLLLATIFLQDNLFDDYQSLSDRWGKASKWPSAWFVLNADLKVGLQKNEEAIAFLQSQSFNGSQDVARLGRLALLEPQTDKALAYLQEAQHKDSNNPFLPILTARVLEKANRITEASQELSKALKTEGPKQTQQIEALADLFIRYGYQPFAISVWDSANAELPSETAAKSLFWKHMLASASRNEKSETPAENAYLNYLSSLPKEVFWDDEAFSNLPDHEFLQQTHQEIYWLRLLDMLAKGAHANAIILIQGNAFKASSWNPSLEVALEAALNKHLSGIWAAAKPLKPSLLDVEYGTSHWLKPQENPLIASILSAVENDSDLDGQDQTLLGDHNAFAILFLAEGWEKAALALHKNDENPKNYPQWYTVNLTKALAASKGTDEALRFALAQADTPELTIAIAELYMLSGQLEKGIDQLQVLRTQNSDTGARAAWISAQYYWKKGKLDAARQIIMANRHLAETPMGKEALAMLTGK